MAREGKNPLSPPRARPTETGHQAGLPSQTRGARHLGRQHDKQHEAAGAGVYCRWTQRFREEGDGLWALCSESYGGRVERERAGYGLPDGGGPGLTAEELRRARPRASSPPATLPILQDDDSRDARLFHEDGVRAQLGTAHPLGWGRRTLEGRRSSSGWKGWLPRSSPHRGLPRLFRRLAVPA